MAILSSPFGFIKLWGSSSIFAGSSSVGSTLKIYIIRFNTIFNLKSPKYVFGFNLKFLRKWQNMTLDSIFTRL